MSLVVNVSDGSITTGSAEQQVWPCPLCFESGSTFRARASRLRDRSLRTSTLGEVLAVPIERWQGAISENLARTLSHRCVVRTLRTCTLLD
jgi:hypothetical protein